MSVDLSAVAQITGLATGVATLATVVFAVYRWYNTTVITAARQARRDIVRARDELVLQVSEYQSLVTLIAQRVLDPRNPQARQGSERFLKLTKGAKSQDDLKNKLEKMPKLETHEWVLYSMVPDLQNLGNIIPHKLTSGVYPLKGSLPVLHRYVLLLARECAVAFKGELGPSDVAGSVRASVLAAYSILNQKREPFAAGFEGLTLDKYILGCRAILANYIVKVKDTTHVDVHNKVLFKILEPMLEYYLARSDSELFRMRGEESGVELKESGTIVEQLSWIVTWRLGKNKPELAASLNGELGSLAQMVRTENEEEDE